MKTRLAHIRHRLRSYWIAKFPIFLPYWVTVHGWRLYPTLGNIRSNFDAWSVELCPHRVEIPYARINETLDWLSDNADDLWCMGNRTIELAYQYPHVEWPAGLGARARGLSEDVKAQFYFRNPNTAFVCRMMFG